MIILFLITINLNLARISNYEYVVIHSFLQGSKWRQLFPARGHLLTYYNRTASPPLLPAN